MGGTRSAVVAAIIASEDAGEGDTGTRRRLSEAGFDLEGTPYPAFLRGYFSE